VTVSSRSHETLRITLLARDHFAPSHIDTALPTLSDARTGEDHSRDIARDHAGGAVGVFGVSTAAAGLAGADALTGYAGMASAVLRLGLGGASTAITSAYGITAAGGGTLVAAAATTALTAAVGGPVVAAAAVVGTVGAVGDVGDHAVRRVASLFD